MGTLAWREETDWSQLWVCYQGLMLLPCKQALGMRFHGPWKMDMQLLFKSALILDYSMCMIWTWVEGKERNSSEVLCSQLCGLMASRGRSHPLPPATSFKMRLRPRQAAAARRESIQGEKA